MFPTEAQRHRECEGGKVREDDVRRITGDIIDSAMKIHKMFGPGLLESVYERLLSIELRKRGHVVECQKSSALYMKARRLEMRLDLICLWMGRSS